MCVKIWPSASFVKILKCLSIWSDKLIGLRMQIPFIFPKLNVSNFRMVLNTSIYMLKEIVFCRHFSQIAFSELLCLYSDTVGYHCTWLSLWIPQSTFLFYPHFSMILYLHHSHILAIFSYLKGVFTEPSWGCSMAAQCKDTG